MVWPQKVAANFRFVHDLAGATAAVVKADAYGLGLKGVLPALCGAGCDSFFVARLEEGIALRALLGLQGAPRQSRIFVLDGVPGDAMAALISHRLIPVLGSLAEIATWQGVGAYARRRRYTLDTGDEPAGAFWGRTGHVGGASIHAFIWLVVGAGYESSGLRR